MRNIIKKLIVGSLLTVSVLGVFATGCKKTTANIPANGNEEPLKPIESPVTDGDGNELYENKVYSLPRNMVFSAPSIMSAETEQEVTVKATVTPDSATDKTVDWSVAFKNSESEWATGKTVTDYVTVTPVSDGSLTAKVSNLQAFGEQIILTCTSRSNTSIKATCTVDYKQAYTKQLMVTGFDSSIGKYNLSSGETPVIKVMGFESETGVRFKYGFKADTSSIYSLAAKDCFKFPALDNTGVTISTSDQLKTALGMDISPLISVVYESSSSGSVGYSVNGLFDSGNASTTSVFKSLWQTKKAAMIACSSKALKLTFKDNNGDVVDEVWCDIDYTALGG